MMASMSMMVVMTKSAKVMKIFVTSEMVAPSRGFEVTERFFWHHSNSSAAHQANIKYQNVKSSCRS